jgi:hypothetical protein
MEVFIYKQERRIGKDAAARYLDELKHKRSEKNSE